VGPLNAIAGQTGKQILRLPGGHLGYMTVPEVFAKKLLELLSQQKDTKDMF
jgi:hypothetical protein